jgi:hypothetical protein
MIEGLLIYIAVVVSVMFYKLYPRSIKISGKDFSYQVNKMFDGKMEDTKRSLITPVGNNIETLSNQLDELKAKKNIRRFQHKEK